METVRVSEAVGNLTAESCVLDLGCGEGRHSHALQWHLSKLPRATIVGLDLSLVDLQTARRKGADFFKSQEPAAHYTCASAYQLPFNDATFDAVIFSEVLEHLADDDAALSEAARILKPGGFLYLSVPRFWPERICWALSSAYHQVEGGHLRIYRRKALETKLTKLSLLKHAHYYAHALHSPYWWLRCLFWQKGESAWPCRIYHKLLVWDLLKKPKLTRALERLLNPIMGKSTVWHYQKLAENSPLPTDTALTADTRPTDTQPKEPSCTPS